MEEGTNCVDRISELPDFILHHILSCLSTREAAQTSLLSKRWQYVWQTFPILDCNEWFFGRELDILNPKELGLPKIERRKIFNQRVKFMSYVDEKLHRFVEENLRVNKFLLHITLVSNNLAPRIDSWMELITKLSVRELDLYLTVGRERFYVLPMKVFAMESLTVLNLRGCLLSSPLNMYAIKRCSLIELHLRDVSIDEGTIRDLINSIHSMEVFTLKNCLGFENLEIRDHDKLKKVVYHPHNDLKVKKFSIKAPNLEELDFCSFDKDKKPCEINISSCRNLKCLSLCGIPIGSKWLQSMISSFHLLEFLFLGGCVLQKVMKLSSPVLKEMYICSCKSLVEAEFDMPNISVFDYRGRNMPRLYMDSVFATRLTELSVHPENMDSSWFMKLYSFLRENKFQDLTLSLTRKSGNEFPFSVEEFMGFQFPAPLELKNMKLVTHALTLRKYGALLDGLLWNIRPGILSLELNLHSPEFLKGLLKALVVEENPNCWCSSEKNLKCWRHSLKDIKLINVKGFSSDTRLDSITLNTLIKFLDDWAIDAQKTVKSYRALTGETLSFRLSW